MPSPTCFSVTGDQRRRVVGDAAVQRVLSAIDALQHERAGQQLEGAAHQEALVGPVLEARAGRGVEDRDAEAAAARAVEGRELPLDRHAQRAWGWIAELFWGCKRMAGYQAAGGEGAETASIHHRFLLVDLVCLA
jgi:hypothetical protein